MPCFYAPKFNEKDNFLTIADEEFHHIAHVFRKKIDDEILITNGKGILAKAKIIELQKKELSLKIIDREIFSHPKPDIAVAFSLLKNKNDFLVVEKLTELGVREFFPITTLRTVKKSQPKLKEKYIKTAISAIKQCDNAFLPEVNAPIEFYNLFNFLKDKGYIPFIAYENEKQTTFFDVYKNEDRICLIFGPEGGFSSEEVSFIKENKIKTFTLGNHILRAETAAISASAIVINHFFEKNREYY